MSDDPRKQDQMNDPEHMTPHPRGEQSSPPDGGGADEDEKTQVLGHMAPAVIAPELLPREEVRQILLNEAKANEQYEDEAYDARIKPQQDNAKKAEEAMKYDPDKLREDAKKLNEAAADPKQAEAQAKAIQELRKKKFPQEPAKK